MRVMSLTVLLYDVPAMSIVTKFVLILKYINFNSDITQCEQIHRILSWYLALDNKNRIDF